MRLIQLSVVAILTVAHTGAAFAQRPAQLVNHVFGVECSVSVMGRLQPAFGSGIVLGIDEATGTKAARVTGVTNHHVVERCEPGSIVAFDTQNNRARVTVKAADSTVDVAIVTFEMRRLQIAPVVIGSSEKIEIGQHAWVVGNPLGQGLSVTGGIITGVNRSVEGTISTDAPVNPGNSGGALLDIRGRLLGMITLKSGEGMGFAIPVERVLHFFKELRQFGRVRTAQFGVYLCSARRDTDWPEEIAVLRPGNPLYDVVICGLQAGSRTAGLEVGDQVIAVGGVSTVYKSQVQSALKRIYPGEDVEWRVLRRSGGRLSLTLKPTASK